MLEFLLLSKEPDLSCLQYKEIVQVVRESEVLSKKEKNRLLKKIQIPPLCS